MELLRSVRGPDEGGDSRQAHGAADDLPDLLEELRRLPQMPEPVQEVLSCKLSSFTALDHLVQQQGELIDDNQQLRVRLKRLPDDAFPLDTPRVGKLFAQFQLELPDFELFDVLCCRREKRAEEAFDIATELRGFDPEICHEILWSVVILAVKPDHIEAGSRLKIQFQHEAGFADAARCCQQNAMAL